MSPAAEVSIGVDLVRALLREQHPDLADRRLAVVAQGWDNVMVRIGDDLVARLPRRTVAVALLEHEQRWLPEIAPLLPVPVPEPVRLGAPGDLFAWPWTITAWHHGVRAADRPRASRTAWAADLARALAALHVPAPDDAPHNPVRAVPLATRDDVVRSRLDGELARVLPLWRRGVEAPAWQGPPVWVHGDPHPGNVLVAPGPDAADGTSDPGSADGTSDPGSADGTSDPGSADSTPRGDALAVLLDFGDLSAGDPACDLAAAWLHLDAAGRTVFRAAYERVAGPAAADPGRWERAAAWAVSMASGVVVLAPDDAANLPWARGALAELRRSATTPA